MTSLLDRFQLIEGTPPALPGKCAVCGTTAGPMIDFGLELDFYGVVYLCVDNCMVQLANAFEYRSPRQWRMLMNQINDQRDEINKLRDQNEQLTSALTAITAVSRIPSIDRTSELDVDAVSQDSEQRSEQLAFDFAAGEDTDSKQNDESRLSDIRRNESGDDDLTNFLLDI